jgi:hypothetical protein
VTPQSPDGSPVTVIDAWARLTNLGIDPSRFPELAPFVERRLSEAAELSAIDPGDVEMALVFPYRARDSADAE